MEVIQTVFSQLEADIHQKLKVLEKQVVFILSAQQAAANPSDEFLAIRKSMNAIAARLESMEDRMSMLETKTVPHPTPAMVASAGLEGLLMKPITLPSPVLSAKSENQVVQPIAMPIFQRQIVIPEQEEVEPDDEAVQGAVAEEVGGIDDETEQEEEEQETEEQEEQEEEEEAETIELEEFIWKGKTYFKTPDHMVYRANDEGDVEDEPFAKYDPKTNTLKRI